MAKQAQTTKLQTVVIVNDKPTMQYETKVAGTAVEILHAFRRRYIVRIGGNDAGYITARDVMNAVGRVETAPDLKTLKGMLH